MPFINVFADYSIQPFCCVVGDCAYLGYNRAKGWVKFILVGFRVSVQVSRFIVAIYFLKVLVSFLIYASYNFVEVSFNLCCWISINLMKLLLINY